MRIGKIILAAAVAALLGCKTGTTARFEQRKAVGLTTTELGELTIPVLAISEGPSATIYQSSSAGSVAKVQGWATTTNRTTFLGIYENEERKTFQFKGTFTLTPTNPPAGCGCTLGRPCTCGETCRCGK